MAFTKGKSGNPKGRPKSNRALTEILQRAGDTRLLTADGSNVESKMFLAYMLWSAATSGKVKFADGRQDVLSSSDWFDIVQFIYRHVDGAPKKELDVTSAGSPITLNILGVIPDDESDDSNTDDPAL